MRVPLTWLRELVDVDADAEELAQRLSATGSAVDRIEHFAEVSGVVVGSVLEVRDVPESDKLCIAQVDAGSAGRVTVLAGAKNFAAGDRVPLALPGAHVTTLEEPVSVRPMVKGKYESHGMLCSATELGIAEDHSGILVLPPDAEVGADVASLYGLDDVVFEFEIYPNRPDQMSMIGIAREVSVLYGVPVKVPTPDLHEDPALRVDASSVSVEDTKGCPRYLARVLEDVTFAPSPPLVQARLTACGFRPLGNIVDATNYVLLLTGQPLHAFDLDLLGEGRVIVRRADEGEKLVTIDGTERVLREHDIVIADPTRAVALAGVMGGSDTEVGPKTKRVLLESAFFEPSSISRTARELHIRTEASSRFERGTDPEAVGYAAALAASLITSWSTGRVATGEADAGAAPARRKLVLRPHRVTTILGVELEPAETDRVLRALGCAVEQTEGAFEVVAPSWRPDLEREIDLIEEIARLHGYDSIEARFSPGRQGGRSAQQELRERVREVLLGAGLNEATLSSFIDEEDLRRIGYDGPRVSVTNPMTVDQKQLRPTLFPGLLRAAERNLAHGVADVRLFEFGTIFGRWPKGADLPEESEHVAFVLAGSPDLHWSAGAQAGAFDAFDARGIIELITEELGVGGWEIRDGAAAFFHPGRSADIFIGDQRVGRFGEIRPSVARSFDLESAVVGGFALPPLYAASPATLEVRDLPTRPPVLRDIAMWLPDDLAAASAEAAIREAAGEILEEIRLVDVYPDPEGGRRSLAFRLTFRAPDRSLTAQEADASREAAAEAVTRLGAQVR